MIFSRRTLLFGALGGALSGCATSKFKTYDGPEVTRIQVFKEARILQLIHERTLLKAYKFELGFAPSGHKVFEGDGRTPEGAYRINDIFIHGTPKVVAGERDWTVGCIAVTDAEMEEIYAMVNVGTKIFIYP